MTKLILIFAVAVIVGCEQNTSNKAKHFDDGKLYRLYFHVSRDINDDEKEVYHYDYTPLTKIQRDTLAYILRRRGAWYKICSDSTILVSTISVPDAVTMSAIDDELKKRLHKEGYIW